MCSSLPMVAGYEVNYWCLHHLNDYCMSAYCPPYPGGNTTELADCSVETGSNLFFLEIQSRQVWHLGGWVISSISLPGLLHIYLFVTFMLYPGNPWGGLTVASVEKLKHFSRTRLQSRKVSQLSHLHIFLLQSTILFDNGCMRSSM